MFESQDRCARCGGANERSARTLNLGEGEGRISYFHYFLKCVQCASEIEDTRLVALNGVGARTARTISRLG
jgi:hypothetical protein